jgi:hypothetical protein
MSFDALDALDVFEAFDSGHVPETTQTTGARKGSFPVVDFQADMSLRVRFLGRPHLSYRLYMEPDEYLILPTPFTGIQYRPFLKGVLNPKPQIVLATNVIDMANGTISVLEGPWPMMVPVVDYYRDTFVEPGGTVAPDFHINVTDAPGWNGYWPHRIWPFNLYVGRLIGTTDLERLAGDFIRDNQIDLEEALHPHSLSTIHQRLDFLSGGLALQNGLPSQVTIDFGLIPRFGMCCGWGSPRLTSLHATASHIEEVEATYFGRIGQRR